jgi:tetratricopeptide (TPR) repeat protein
MAIVLPSKKILLMILAGFFSLTLLPYAASLNNDFVRWDDGLLIYENNAVREMSFASIKTAFTTYDPELYIPWTILSYKIDYAIAGRNPFFYHFHNLVLHSFNAFLVMGVLYVLLRNKWIALAAGILFAVHPLHTEAVAWASARKDLLSTFFFLGSLLSYLWWRSKEGNERNERFYILSIGLFLLGLLSKVMVLTLPVILCLVDWKEGRPWSKKMVLEKIPYILLSIFFGIVALYGKRDVTASATLWETVLMAGKSTMFYLQKLFLPTGLSVLYPYTESITLSSPDFFLPIFALFVILALLAFTLRSTKHFAFGFLFFFITLAPTFINFSKGGDYYFASDRYAYLPSLGILFIVGYISQDLLFREGRYQVVLARLRGAMVFFGILTIIFIGLTYRQSLVWADTMTLFQHVTKHYPNAHRARNNLGNAYRRQGLLPEAIEEFEAAISIREEPKTLSNLGAVYRRQGKMADALQKYERALEIAPSDPEPHFGLGLVYAEQGKFAEALASYDRALHFDPQYADVRSNIGALFMSEGKVEEAISEYRKAIAIDPYHIQSRYNLAVALAKMGKTEEGIVEYTEVISREPTFLPARINLGILLFEAGKTEEAITQFEEVLKIDPGNRTATSALQQIRGDTSP